MDGDRSERGADHYFASKTNHQAREQQRRPVPPSLDGQVAEIRQQLRWRRRPGPAAPPWLDEPTALLVSLLADRHNLTVTEDAARQDISDDLDHLARLMRTGRQVAKMYVTDEVISDMADRIAAAVAEHQTTAVAEHQGVVRLDTERRQRR